MKKNILVLALLVYTNSFVYANNLLQTSTGFYYPVNKKHSGAYLGFGSRNSNYGNQCHLANDYKVSEGTSVYSVSSGVVVKADLYVSNYGGDTPSISGGAIVIKHLISNGKVFYALYGHLKNFKVSKGDTVKGGQHIGDVRSYYSGSSSLPHLHFGINTSIPSYRGYTPTTTCSDYRGYIDPEPFLESNSPKEETTIVISNKSIFDGAGSLVSPDENCYGCDRDVAIMHPHSGENSTVVFQWLRKDSCSQIDIHSNRDIGDVIIRAKGWDDHETKVAEQVKLTSSPITIRRPNRDKSWTTLAVTTTKPLDEKASISAYCKDSSSSYKDGGRSIASKDLVDMGWDYYWSGTGSVISQATKRGSTTYGIGKDLAVTFDSNKSLTSFQWDTSSCKQLTITNGGTSYATDASVDIKVWNEPNWETVCHELPCIIDKSDSDYYVLKIKSDIGAITQEEIKVECTD